MNAIKLTLLAVLLLITLSACQDGSKITGPRVRLSDRIKPVQDADLRNNWTGNQTHSEEFDQAAVNPGYIIMTNDARNLYISYYLTDNWQLSGGEVNFTKMLKSTSENDFQLVSHSHLILGQCETAYTQVIPLAELNLKPGDEFMFDSKALIYGNNTSEGISLPPELCVPGKVDQEWRQISVGKIHFNPKYPSQQMQIELKPYFSDSQNI